MTVISVADDAGTAGETGLLQVDEEGVDGRCPWSCRTQHGVAVPQDWGGLAFGSGERLEGRMRRHGCSMGFDAVKSLDFTRARSQARTSVAGLRLCCLIRLRRALLPKRRMKPCHEP